MTNCMKANVPIEVDTPSLDNYVVDLKTYRRMICSLLYIIASRPNILFFVCNCARYQENPTENHLIAVKNILHYLHPTKTFGLLYPSKTVFFFQAFSYVDL